MPHPSLLMESNQTRPLKTFPVLCQTFKVLCQPNLMMMKGTRRTDLILKKKLHRPLETLRNLAFAMLIFLTTQLSIIENYAKNMLG